ncbi:MAG: hypothetical protein WBW33_35665 [Bryobacteraceae bacterium]
MKRYLKSQLALGILFAAGCELYAAGRQSNGVDRQPVAVHVYDLAGVSAKDLHEATEEAGRILATAGMEAVWQFGAADAPEAHEVDSHAAAPGARNQPRDTRDYLVLRMVRDFPERALPGALGISFPDARSGVHATIFYDRFERVSKTGDVALATMLGHAMAHELGHVLLGNTEHSAAGIMKARWGRADYRQAGMGLMTFSAQEREAIQKRAAVRLSARSQQ